ncbi:MAG: peptide chain release factor N(5)-glutamine methyltransferase [Clostridia bacterium]|nr:peptide chain release factor N(5)-glutamine methyltransferase [Clostridia bacterium]
MTLNQIIDRLFSCGIENADDEARMLAAHVTHLDTSVLRLLPDTPLPDPDGRLEALVARREAREPLQYLLGTWGFWRQEYEVSPDCLIPRPDTETLVDYAVRHLPKGARVLDLCTGSGCIAISLLCERPDLTGVAVELYEDTLAVARRNAARNGVTDERLTLLQGDVLRGDFLEGLGTFDAILSNPPYIPTATVATLAPELAFEPQAALDGGEDGLVFYRRMLQDDYRAALRENGVFAFEIGYDQGAALRALAGGCDCEILRDLGGCDRVAIIRAAHILE